MIPAQTLSKAERLSSRAAIEALVTHGHSGTAGAIRYRYLAGNGLPHARILVSVPKRHFKRAVRRNLLKRRMREAYRRQKSLIGPGVDLMLVYLPRELHSYADIYADITTVLRTVGERTHSQEPA